MLLWFDILTPKQALLFGNMAKRLAGEGFDVLITAREYNYTVDLLKLLKLDFKVLGGYGEDLEEKLDEDLRRARLLSHLITSLKEKPSYLISYASPSAVRVAFGLKIPSIILCDTPHAEAVHRLTVPLAKALIHSEFIPSESLQKYVLSQFTEVVTYRGVDELEYVKDYLMAGSRNTTALREAGLKPGTYVVVRPPEVKASYYSFGVDFNVKALVSLIRGLGHDVVFLPRYGWQVKELGDLLNEVTVLKKPIYGLDLEFSAIAVVTGGASMAREASLLGTPSFTTFPGDLPVEKALSRMGFPIYHIRSFNDLMSKLREVLSEPSKYRVNTKGIISEFKLLKPSDAVLNYLLGY